MDNAAARALGQRRQSAPVLARQIARRWPELDAETRAEVWEVLGSVLVADASGGGPEVTAAMTTR